MERRLKVLVGVSNGVSSGYDCQLSCFSSWSSLFASARNDALIGSRLQMQAAGSPLALRLKSQLSINRPEDLLAEWMKRKVDGLASLVASIGIDDTKEPKSANLAAPQVNAGRAALFAAVDAGYVKVGVATVRSCKTFWLGVAVSKRARKLKIDARKAVNDLCDLIKERLRDNR